MSDSQIRAEVLDTTRSFCVVAPAGSGKTSLLTQRILALLTTVARPEEVLAITFTKKAASEMRARVIEALEAAAREEEPTSEHQVITYRLARAALTHARRLNWNLTADSVNVRTIDGLSAYLNRAMPILSGLGGGATVTDDVVPIYQQATTELYQLIGEPSDRGEALRQLLLTMDNNWQRCSELLIELLSRRADWLNELGQHRNPEAASEQLSATVRAVITERLIDARSQMDIGWLSELESQAQAALQRLREYVRTELVDGEKVQFPSQSLCITSESSSLESWQWLARWVLTSEKTPRKRLDKNGGFQAKVDQTAKQEVLALLGKLEEHPQWVGMLTEITALPRIDSDESEWQGVLHLSRVLPTLAAQLLTVFKARGVVDHTHIAMAAELALGEEENPTDLSLRLDYQLSHILVDEFQDTSQGQFRLIEKLCRGWLEHNSANLELQRTLFVVGDAMQSIYGFRYADVGLFLSAMDKGIAGISLVPRSLSRNFRSHAGLIEWVNDHFSALVPAHGDPRLGVVPMTRAEATQVCLTDESVQIHNFPDDAALEAEYVFQQIASLLTATTTAKIAVLSRTRSGLEPISLLLKQNGVDIVGADLTSFSRRASVTDLVSLTRWLANPGDTVALVALLRSPMVGVSLRDLGMLMPLLKAYSMTYIYNLIDQCELAISQDGRERVSFLLSALIWADRKRDRLNLVSWVEETWKRLGGDRLIAGDEWTDVTAFFHLLRDQEIAGNGLVIEPLTTWLEKRHATIESADARVELMTLHKSKGLEFDHVFIVGAGKVGRSSQKPLLRWNRDHERGLLIAARPDTETNGSLYNYLGFVNKSKEEQELIRLYYVGITRAKTSCTLTATLSSENSWPPKASQGFWSRFCGAASRVHYHPKDQVETTVPQRPLAKAYRRVAKVPDHGLSGDVTESVGAAKLRLSNLSQRRYGIALHRGLELLSHCDNLPAECPQELMARLRFQLLELSAYTMSIEDELGRLEVDINRVLADSNGRWLLSSKHIDAHAELALYLPAERRQLIIDRTFVDPITRCRWVVDYKSSQPEEGTSIDQFVCEEASKYREQLEHYRSAMIDFDGHQDITTSHTKIALYFPSINVFHEVLG